MSTHCTLLDAPVFIPGMSGETYISPDWIDRSRVNIRKYLEANPYLPSQSLRGILIDLLQLAEHEASNRRLAEAARAGYR